MEEPPCDLYLKSKSRLPDNTQVHTIVSKLLRADPDPNGANCEWIIDSYLRNEFTIDEDEQRVKDDILKYKELINPKLPPTYILLKQMIRKKIEESQKPRNPKSKKTNKLEVFKNCREYFKGLNKNSLDDNNPFKGKTNKDLEALFQKIEIANPTNDMRNCIWLVDEVIVKLNIKLNEIKHDENGNSEVKQYLTKYFQKFNMQLPNFYPNFPVTSNYQLVKDAVDGNVELLYAADNGILLIPRNKEASCYYGMQTSWCTARSDENNRYDTYASQGNMYIWFDKNLKDKFQFHFEKDQFMDKDNNPISNELFNKLRKHPALGMIFNEIESKYINDPAKAILYAKFGIQGRFEEAEENIIKYPYLAYEYAKDVIKDRWTKAEKNIIKDPFTAYEYARDIIKDRWEEAEPSILSDQSAGKKYIKYVVKNQKEKDEVKEIYFNYHYGDY
jgi:hypothetical protein